jgi:glycosyltransferase involved in cell wall biosynthesis
MKILHVSETDISGGAARATYRIHNALKNAKVNSRILVNHKISDDESIIGPNTNYQKIMVRLRMLIANRIVKFQKSNNKILHSPALFPSQWLNKINKTDVDLVNLHWINAEMLSIKDIPKINKPLVWTLHDMWAFCGSEHISYDKRYINGYTSKNRPSDEKGLQLNKWIWNLKKHYWKNPINIVTPSNYMAKCVSNSYLMKDWPVTVIPNTINTHVWKPIKMKLARDIMNFPNDCPIICFGAIGINQYHKGFDLLKSSLKLLINEIKDLQLIVFGQSKPHDEIDLGFPIHYTGYLNDEMSLRLIYSSSNVLVVPSRFESFGQTASEAQACGTPVVAFNFSGPKDIVSHKETGYLAKYCDIEDLAKGIKWTIENYNSLNNKSRNNAIKKFSYEIVSNKYKKLYKKILCPT